MRTCISERATSTFGLREAIEGLVQSSPSFDVSKLVDGFYLDSTSHIYLTGGIHAAAQDHRLGFLSADVDGGVDASLSATLLPSLDIDGEPDKVRLAGEMGTNFLTLSGRVHASLTARVAVGVSVPICLFRRH